MEVDAAIQDERAVNLISTQVAQETLKGMKEAQKSMKRGVRRRVASCAEIKFTARSS